MGRSFTACRVMAAVIRLQAMSANPDVYAARVDTTFADQARLLTVGMQAQVFLTRRNSSSVIASAISYWNIP
jgi:hypothetical protein